MRDARAVVEQIVDGDLIGSREFGKELDQLVVERELLHLDQTSENDDRHRLVDRADTEPRSRRVRHTVFAIGQAERLLVEDLVAAGDQQRPREVPDVEYGWR